MQRLSFNICAQNLEALMPSERALNSSRSGMSTGCSLLVCRGRLLELRNFQFGDGAHNRTLEFDNCRIIWVKIRALLDPDDG
jgi:hypothetical protein